MAGKQGTQGRWAGKYPAGKTKARYLSSEEYENLIEDTVDDLEEICFLLMGDMGLRAGEVVHRRFTIENSYEPPFLNVYDEKKDSWRRRLPMSKRLSKLMARYLKGRRKGRIVPKSYEWLRVRAKEAYERLGLEAKEDEYLSTHTLRHSFIRHKQSEGWPVKAVCQFTGDSEAMILSVYSELTPEDLLKLQMGE